MMYLLEIEFGGSLLDLLLSCFESVENGKGLLGMKIYPGGGEEEEGRGSTGGEESI